MEIIADMPNYILSRKKKGKTARQIKNDLIDHGYDEMAAHGLVMLHWFDVCENPECPKGGKCGGECARNF